MMSDKILLDQRKRQLVTTYLPTRRQLISLANYFSSLADETRLKILSALAITDMCVSDISLLLQLNQTTVSHQLAKLRREGIVSFRRQGKISFYSLCDEKVSQIMLLATEKERD